MLEVATEVFCERGYAGASMNEIASRCGISKPMLYLYFDSKERLYLACVSFVGEALIDAIETSVAGAASTTEQVLATAAGLFDFAERRNRAWWGVIYGETMPADSTVAEATTAYRDRIQAIVSRALATVLADPLDVALASRALIGAGEALLRWWVDRPDVTAAELTARLVRILAPFTTGLAADSDRSAAPFLTAPAPAGPAVRARPS